MVDFSSKLCIEQTILTVEQELRRIINSRLSQFCFFLHLRLCTDSSPVVFSQRARRGGGAAGAEGDGKGKGRKTTSLSLAFLLPITPLAPLRRDRERRLGTSQGCGYKLKGAVASRSLNTGSWVLLRVFTIYTRLAYKSSSNFFTSAKRRP